MDIIGLREIVSGTVSAIYDNNPLAPAREHLEFYLYWEDFSGFLVNNSLLAKYQDFVGSVISYCVGIHNNIVNGIPFGNKELFYLGCNLIYQAADIDKSMSMLKKDNNNEEPAVKSVRKASAALKHLNKANDSLDEMMKEFGIMLNAEKLIYKGDFGVKERYVANFDKKIREMEARCAQESISLADAMVIATGKQDAR